MTNYDLSVHNGPDKADLLRAVVNPDSHLHVSFAIEGDAVEAHIDKIDEIGQDGLTFGLEGHLTSGIHKGTPFAGTYNVESRTGRLILRRDTA